jgi:aryl-alcohol dehydrogenase-like predicted oxidoreductase
VFDAYVDAGGNFIDTADVYAGGRSEERVGTYVADRNLRDALVLATKFTFGADGGPNASGNGRKNMYRALEGSLRRLRTDYVDLYYTHLWDTLTPVEEVLQSLGDLVRAGKIRYFGFCNVPAAYAAKAATIAAVRGVPGPIALQLNYSLVDREIEREHVYAARECGLGIVPWGPLSSGFLSGKYERIASAPTGSGRFESRDPNRPYVDRDWRALDALRTVADEIGRSPAQTALAWAATQLGIDALLLGARTVDQLRDNLASIDIHLTPEQRRTLDESSALEPPAFYTSALKAHIFDDDVRGFDR